MIVRSDLLTWKMQTLLTKYVNGIIGINILYARGVKKNITKSHMINISSKPLILNLCKHTLAYSILILTISYYHLTIACTLLAFSKINKLNYPKLKFFLMKIEVQ